MAQPFEELLTRVCEVPLGPWLSIRARVRDLAPTKLGSCRAGSFGNAVGRSATQQLSQRAESHALGLTNWATLMSIALPPFKSNPLSVQMRKAIAPFGRLTSDRKSSGCGTGGVPAGSISRMVDHD